MRTRAAARTLDLRRFDAVTGAVIEDLTARGYSASMLKQTRLVLPPFFSYLRRQHRIRDLRAVTEAHLFAYARHLATTKTKRGEPYSLSSQTTHLMHVRRLFRFLLRRALVLRDPSLDLVLPTWSKLPRVVPTVAQVRKLLTVTAPNTALGRRDRALLELLYGSGIRVGECERLDLQDLDLAHGTLFVRNGKGRKDRVVPVAGRAAVTVEDYLTTTRPRLVSDPREIAVFLSATGERLKKKAIQHMVRQQVKAAGLALPVTPHALRHSYATHMLQRGADVRHVQQLLGHSQLQTTALYARVAPTDLARVVAKAHPRERLYNRRRR